MTYLAALKMIVFHNMMPLYIALWTSIVAVVGSATTTWMAYADGDFTLMRYWTVSAAVVTIACALISAVRGKVAADAEPPLAPRLRVLFG